MRWLKKLFRSEKPPVLLIEGKLDNILEAVHDELIRAERLHGKFNSIHEGYAVLLEEVDELWDQVKLKTSKRDPDNMRTECIQIAAMAARFYVDLL